MVDKVAPRPYVGSAPGRASQVPSLGLCAQRPFDSIRGTGFRSASRPEGHTKNPRFPRLMDSPRDRVCRERASPVNEPSTTVSSAGAY